MPQEQVVPVVIGLGEVLWDMLPAGKQLGGAPANFAYHARQLGAEAHVVSSVGRDALGAELLAQLDRLGLRGDFVAVDPPHATGVVTVALNQRGEPSYVIHENVAWGLPSRGRRAGGPGLAGRRRLFRHAGPARRPALLASPSWPYLPQRQVAASSSISICGSITIRQPLSGRASKRPTS